MRVRAALAVGAALIVTAATAQTRQAAEAIDPGEWPRYTRDLGGTRYSPLNQINTGNVGKLAEAWSFRVRPEGGGSTVSSATPIVVGGMLYLPIGNAVVALEPETGKELWRHPVTGGAARRTVSYWPGDASHKARIYYSIGKQIIGLDAKTGEPDPSFGTNGAITLDVPFNYPPTVYKNVIVIGATTSEMIEGDAGDTRAFDAATGKPVWTFHTVRVRASRATRPGSTTAGRTAPAPTSGSGT